MVMPGRKYSAGSSYRYGFNGKEKDNETYGEGNAYDFDNRIYDPRLGHWFSLDKLQAKRPGESPYLYCGGSPIVFIDPDGKDRIISTMITREFADGRSVTVTKTEVLKGLDTYRKVQQYDAHGKPTGRFEYHDIIETHTTIYNSKGENVGGSTSNLTSDNVEFVSDNDLDTWSGRWIQRLGGDADKEHRNGGGGITFTSKRGEGGAPSADFTDKQMENIDALMDAASAVGNVADAKAFTTQVQGYLKSSGLEKKVAGLELFKLINNMVATFIPDDLPTSVPKVKQPYEGIAPGTIVHPSNFPRGSNVKVLTDSTGQTSEKPATDTIKVSQ